MNRIADRFSAGAQNYDAVVQIQPLVAARLAARLPAQPRRILEIGCGTGGLSTHLLKLFPDAEIILSDISPVMLALCQKNIGTGPSYRCLDAAALDVGIGSFDLIISSLALQWVADLPACLAHLASHLNPGGRLEFAILGDQNFQEWRQLLENFGAESGLHLYPSAEKFPWPVSCQGHIEQEFLAEPHKNAAAFLKALKKIGAGSARPDHKPLSARQMRQILKATDSGFTVSYHVLYGSLGV